MSHRSIPPTPPGVSVIIPTYNRARLLREALESLRAQTYEGFEAIVVDDGSTDGTRNVVESFDERFEYVYQTNSGRSNARNNALRLARGRYIAFLDSDDLFLPHKLQVQTQCLEEHPDVGWVYSSALNIDEHGEVSPFRYEATASGWIYSQIALFIPLTVLLPSVVVRREVMETVGDFDEEMDRFEDTDMWRRISRNYQALAIPEPLLKVRTHPDNAMEDPRKVFRSISYYVDKVFREDRDVDPTLLRNRASDLFLLYGKAVYARPHWRSLSRPFLFASLRYRRTQVRAAEMVLATYFGDWILSVGRFLRRVVKCIRQPPGRRAH
jgi:glycosyltransferase involved in cell wall biosynthesis